MSLKEKKPEKRPEKKTDKTLQELKVTENPKLEKISAASDEVLAMALRKLMTGNDKEGTR